MENEKEQDCRKKFLEDRFFAASWDAASERNNVWRDEYKDHKDDKHTNERTAFLSQLKIKAQEMLKVYEKPTTYQEHPNLKRLFKECRNQTEKCNGDYEK